MVRSFSWPGLIDCKLIILIVNYGKFAAEYRVQDLLQMEPRSGHLFLFRSRGGNKLKALYYEEYSFTLWYRRLEKGRFMFPRNAQGHLELTKEHFQWLLSSNKFVDYAGADTQIYRDFY